MSSSKLLIFLILSTLLHAALGKIICENMPTKICALMISSQGKRCLLETSNVTGEFHCRTSDNDGDEYDDNHEETDECKAACGVDRKTIDMSSESLKELTLVAKLCSPSCYDFCPNIVAFHFDNILNNGAYLPDLCDAIRENPHSLMLESDIGTKPAPYPA